MPNSKNNTTIPVRIVTRDRLQTLIEKKLESLDVPTSISYDEIINYLIDKDQE